MKKLLYISILALIVSCSITETCNDCQKDPISIRDTIVNTIRDTVVQTDTIVTQVFDTVYVDRPVTDTLIVEVRDTVLVPQIDTLIVTERDTITLVEIDSVLCRQITKDFDFNDYPKGCPEVNLDGIHIDSNKGYRIVDTYAGKGMYLEDGISFDFSSYGEDVELDYIYYKAVECSGEYLYWDNGQMELPKRPHGQPVFINIDQVTQGMYFDIRKRIVILGFGIKYYDCEN